MATQEDIIDTIAEELTLTPADIDPEKTLVEGMGLSRIEVANLINSLAERFKIFFTLEEKTQLKTMGDLVELVEDKLLEV